MARTACFRKISLSFVEWRCVMFALVERVREKLVVGVIAIFVCLAVYTALGLAWSVKLAVEAPQRLWHHH